MKQIPLPIDMRQPPPKPESARLYGSVLSLRRRGFRVHRAGAPHAVDGKKLTARELMRFAEEAR